MNRISGLTPSCLPSNAGHKARGGLGFTRKGQKYLVLLVRQVYVEARNRLRRVAKYSKKPTQMGLKNTSSAQVFSKCTSKT